jgi:hypothetical protein
LWRAGQATPWAWPPFVIAGASLGSWLHRGWGALIGLGISCGLISSVVVLARMLQPQDPWSVSPDKPIEANQAL